MSSYAAGDAASSSVAGVQEDEGDYYVVNLPKPLGVSFRRGNDGRAYVADVNPARGNIDPNFELGDRIVEVVMMLIRLPSLFLVYMYTLCVCDSQERERERERERDVNVNTLCCVVCFVYR